MEDNIEEERDISDQRRGELRGWGYVSKALATRYIMMFHLHTIPPDGVCDTKCDVLLKTKTKK